MSHVIKPQLLGADRFHVGKNLSGEFIFTINEQTMRMSPAQVHDLAIKLLQSLGHQIEAINRAENPHQGPKLIS